jgi:3-hydroxyisobutyrate dehydrogenase-like beta-hydroxyacid dehydrogenase
MRVGFIGLGNMGGGMAANLLNAGHALTVYNPRLPRPMRSSLKARRSPKRQVRPRAVMWSSLCSPTTLPSNTWRSARRASLGA